MKENKKLPGRCFSAGLHVPMKSFQIREDFEIATDENGCEYLVKIGEHNQYDEVQSYADAVNFDRILERIALGDTSMLRPITDANFFDSSVLPDSPFEVIKLKQNNLEKFNQLPSDVRALFDNRPEVFYDSIINKSIDSIMENFNKQNSTSESNNNTNNGGDK